ncbi:MAG: HAD family phosphatase [Candidatus Andersenbacteria bacterium]
MIRSIIFDLGNTLIDDPADQLTAFTANAFGVSIPQYTAVVSQYFSDFQRGAVEEIALWQQVAKDLEVATPTMERLQYQAFASAYRPRPEMYAFVDELRSQKYRVGLLSNTERGTVEYFLEQPHPQFDATVFSCAEGTVKPEAKIYELALERLGAAPKETIYIDDKEEYTRAAEALGIHGVTITHPEQAIRDIKTLLNS